MYANNLDSSLFVLRGFWYDFADTAAEIFKMYLALGCWSWTSGFVLGSASRGIRVNGLLFCLMLAFGVLLGAPLYFAYYEHYLYLTIGFPVFVLHHQRDPVNALAFYRVMFPLIVQAVLVLFPALWGMREGARAVRLRLWLRTVLWTAAIASLVAVVIQNPDLWMFLKLYGRAVTPWHGWPGRLLQLCAYWPVVFMLGVAITRRSRGGRVVSHAVLP
jgi:hypothetical protein